MYIYKPSGGSYIAFSTNSYSSYELVEFIAPETGRYRIYVPLASGTELSNQVGIAWVNDSTFLADLRNKDGFASILFVRNDGAVYKSVQIHYFDQNGTHIIFSGYDHDTCNLYPNGWCSIAINDLSRIPPGAIGSATVSGGEDISVMAQQRNYNPEVYAA